MTPKKRTETACQVTCPECGGTSTITLRATITTGHAHGVKVKRQPLSAAARRKISVAVRRRWQQYRADIAETERRKLAGLVFTPAKGSSVESSESTHGGG